MSQHDHTARLRWPTGWLMLAGLLIGAAIGWVAGLVPVGMVAGLAVGVGIDSLLHHRLDELPMQADKTDLDGR